MPVFRMKSVDLPKWGHTNGWIIQKCVRDWSLRGFGGHGIVGLNTNVNPKTWYEIHPMYGKRVRDRRVPEHSETLFRDARAWCDTHVRTVLNDGGVITFATTEIE